MGTSHDQSVPFAREGSTLLSTTSSGFNDRHDSMVVGNTLVFGSNMVNSFRVAYNSLTVNKQGARFFSPDEVGIGQWTSVPGHFVLISAWLLLDRQRADGQARDGAEPVPGEQRLQRHQRVAPVRRRRHLGPRRRGVAGAHARGRRPHLLGQHDRERAGRLPARQCHRDAAVDAEHAESVSALRRALRAGHVARRLQPDVQPGRQVGAVHSDGLDGEPVRRHPRLQLRRRPVQGRPAQRGVSQRASRLHLSEPAAGRLRPGRLRGPLGHRGAVEDAGAACRRSLGPDGPGAHLRPRRLRHRLRRHRAAGAAQLQQRLALGGRHHPPHRHAGRPVGRSGRRQPVPVRLADQRVLRTGLGVHSLRPGAGHDPRPVVEPGARAAGRGPLAGVGQLPGQPEQRTVEHDGGEPGRQPDAAVASESVHRADHAACSRA